MAYLKIYKKERNDIMGEKISNEKNKVKTKKEENTNQNKDKNKVKHEVEKKDKTKVIEKEVKKEKKKNNKEKETAKEIEISPKIEKAFCLIIAIIFVILSILSFSINELIPATLITLSLELFSISYFTKEKNGSDKKVYLLFFAGVSILLFSVFYTIIHTI